MDWRGEGRYLAEYDREGENVRQRGIESQGPLSVSVLHAPGMSKYGSASTMASATIRSTASDTGWWYTRLCSV
jgi:hypothetical protein